MCGFVGVLGAGAAGFSSIHERLAAVLRHRGPDDSGFASGENWALSFRRLSILDLSPTGHQPMCTPDQNHWLVLNGEIYNYVELRRDLEAKGVTFAGTSDSEVLLQLLAREGTAALPKLNGMFAFAYIDLETHAFMIARDRLGVKPLYYQSLPGGLRFASELKALLAWPDAKRDVDPRALVEYLTLNYLPNELCIFEGYHKLAPAHYMTGSLDHPERAVTRAYWKLELNDTVGRSAVTAQEVEELGTLLADATRIRLRSDVPVGVFLSGGIDSGLVATLASQNAPASKPLALTVAFDVEAYNEATLAQQTAENAGLSLQIVQASPGNLQAIDEIAWFYDEPFGDSSALPTYFLCKAAAAHATVFLSGDGGDEAFGGYRRYVEAPRYHRAATLAGALRKVVRGGAAALPNDSPLRYKLTKLSLPDLGYAAAFDGAPDDPIHAAIAGEALRDAMHAGGHSMWNRWQVSRGRHLLTRQQQLDFGYSLPDDILLKVDRASMAHSIEVRSPFLDFRVVEWAARLPRSVMLNDTQGKLPLRALASRLLPPTVQHAVKRGFNVPLDAWFRQDAGRAFATDRLLSRRALDRGWWNAAGVQHLIDAHTRGDRRPFGAHLWRLLMLDAWARRHADADRA